MIFLSCFSLLLIVSEIFVLKKASYVRYCVLVLWARLQQTADQDQGRQTRSGSLSVPDSHPITGQGWKPETNQEPGNYLWWINNNTRPRPGLSGPDCLDYNFAESRHWDLDQEDESWCYGGLAASVSPGAEIEESVRVTVIRVSGDRVLVTTPEIHYCQGIAWWVTLRARRLWP